MLLVVIFSLLLTLAVDAGLLGLPIALVVGSWFFKYAFLLMDHAAHGRPGTPVLSAEDANPLGETRPILYGVAIAAFYGASGALVTVLGPALVSAIRVTGLLLLPAVLATHVVTGSFASALHPLAVAGTVRGLGPGYALVLAAALACGWVGHAIVFDAGHLALMRPDRAPHVAVARALPVARASSSTGAGSSSASSPSNRRNGGRTVTTARATASVIDSWTSSSPSAARARLAMPGPRSSGARAAARGAWRNSNGSTRASRPGPIPASRTVSRRNSSALLLAARRNGDALVDRQGTPAGRRRIPARVSRAGDPARGTRTGRG